MIRSTKEKAMDKATAITYVFLGIGGVPLTNRWDHYARKPAAANLLIAEEQAPLAAKRSASPLEGHQSLPKTSWSWPSLIRDD
jgi:hypothetical protein